MKKLFKKQKFLTITCAIAFVIIFVYFLTYNIPELFPGGGLIFDTIFQIAVGYIINYIFFIVNIYIPQINSEAKALQVCKSSIHSLLGEISKLEDYFNSFITLNLGRISYQTGIIYYKYPNSNGRSFIDITTYLRNEYPILKDKLSSITSNRYFNSLDSSIIELINSIQYSDFLDYLKRFQYCEKDMNNTLFGQNVYITSLEESYKNFIAISSKLSEISGIKMSSPINFIVLKGTALEEYIAFIKEKRLSYNTSNERYSKYYVGNDRIY